MSTHLNPADSRRAAGHGRAPLVIAAAALLAGYVWLVCTAGVREDSDWSHLWIGGRMLVTGRSACLYDPEEQVRAYQEADPQGRRPAVWRERNQRHGAFNYPPPAALLYGLLAWMPMKSAGLWQAFLTLGLAPLVAWSLRILCDGKISTSLALVALLIHPAFFINLSLGQNAVLTLALLAAGWALASRGREVWGGLVLGLLVFKPNMLAAAACVPFVLGRWRMLGGAAVGAALFCALSVLITGGQPFVDYLQVMAGVSRMHETPGYALELQYSAVGLFRRWLGLGPGAELLSVASSVAVIGLTAWTARRCWRPAAGTGHCALVAAASLTAGMWINPHLNNYDLLPLAAAAVLAGGSWAGSWAGRLAFVLAVGLAYVSLPWDASWSCAALLPVPGLAVLALWFFLAVKMLSRVQSEESSRCEARGEVSIMDFSPISSSNVQGLSQNGS